MSKELDNIVEQAINGETWEDRAIRLEALIRLQDARLTRMDEVIRRVHQQMASHLSPHSETSKTAVIRWRQLLGSVLLPIEEVSDDAK